jgi:tetratricopeptide (TPR) repeat protein
MSQNKAPYIGPFERMMKLIQGGPRGAAQALETATAWLDREPGDVIALLAVGEAREALGQPQAAARVYGSIIDLHPESAELRRAAGERLERLGKPWLPLIIDTYRQARRLRPDQPAGYRLLAFALLRAGQPAAAFEVMEDFWKQNAAHAGPESAFEIFGRDAGLLAAAWLRSEPQRRGEVLERLQRMKSTLSTERSLSVVLNWEKDDQGLHFDVWKDGLKPSLISEDDPILKDISWLGAKTSHGPGRFEIRGKALAHAYRMGVEEGGSFDWNGNLLGKVEIIEHDGRGGLRFEERPFVFMQQQSYFQLGVIQLHGRDSGGVLP